MTKKITDDERQLFQDAVSDVKRTDQQPEQNINTTETRAEACVQKQNEIIKIRRIQINKHPIKNTQESFFNFTHHQPAITGSDIISYSKPGLQHKKFSQLKQGKMRAEATLDLHEHTADQTIKATESFLQHCHQHHLKNICIIHGKGNYASDNRPILKNLLNNYLRQHPLVIAFHSAKNNQGGTGALMVIIKS
ncbi:MAG: Smr/MutS family protein [Gammaproteobacteria bacterium]|nr:Smr/MutS family protein [Gammaproteobacteria bacterium]